MKGMKEIGISKEKEKGKKKKEKRKIPENWIKKVCVGLIPSEIDVEDVEYDKYLGDFRCDAWHVWYGFKKKISHTKQKQKQKQIKRKEKQNESKWNGFFYLFVIIIIIIIIFFFLHSFFPNQVFPIFRFFFFFFEFFNF